MRMAFAPAALLALALAAPAPALGAGIAGVTVDVVDPLGPTIVHTTPTDALGAFTVVNVLAGTYRLEATDALGGRAAALGFTVDPADEPARVSGLVSEDAAATVSFAVSAFVSPMSFADAVLADGFPRVQPRWNRNWARSRGRLHVRLAGTGLEAITEVGLASALGSISSTRIVVDPVEGVGRAVFSKAAAFLALAGPGAGRGDVVDLQVGVTTPAGVQVFERSVQVVGPRR